MPRDSRVEPLQFRHPKTGFRYCPGRNFSEKLEVVRVHLLKHSNRAGCPHEVDASGCRVILEVVGATDAVQPLNHFSRLRIDDCQSARFMLVPAPYVARVCYQSTTNKQAMMGRVQASGMRYRPSGDWPLGDHGAFFEIDDCNVAVTSHNISHSDVQSFPRWLDCDARGITAGELNAADQFGRSRVNDVDRGIIGSVLATATKVFKDLDTGINQMGRRIVSRVIRSPVRITIPRQFDGLGYLVRSPANGYNTAICQGRPDFVGVREIERLLGHGREPFGLVDHLACTQVHRYEGFCGLPGNKQALAFHVYRQMVHIAIARQWNGLNQTQKP